MPGAIPSLVCGAGRSEWNGVAMELRANEGPPDRLAGVTLRGERFLSRLAHARGRYGTDAAVRRGSHSRSWAEIRRPESSPSGASRRAAAQFLPVGREFPYFMARGMRRPVVLGMARSTYPTLDPVERPFERINVTNLVL